MNQLLSTTPAKFSNLRFTVGQLGSREHYALPGMLYAHGVLGHFYTDYWVSKRSAGLLRHLPARALQRLAGRRTDSIPDELVTAFPELFFYKAFHRFSGDIWDHYMREGSSFARKIIAHAVTERRDLSGEIFFGFSSASLEALQFWEKNIGPTILDQIDPLAVEHQIIREERSLYPGWEDKISIPSPAYVDRIRREWELAGRILVNSTWSYKALEKQGVPSGKIMNVPLAYSGPIEEKSEDLRYDGKRPLHILWLGSVILRKGIAHLIEAARQLPPQIEIKVAGPIGINLNCISLPSNMTFTGQIPRMATPELWRWADVFVLPTLSDGFAMTQLEAMAHGVPVIATPCCGEVVEPEVNGLLVPARDSEALAAAIMRFRDEPELIAAMSRAAVVRAAHFSEENYWNTLWEQFSI